MPSLETVFTLHNARSVALGRHKAGDVAYVTNGLKRNGIVGFVKPLPGDRAFDFLGIVLSTFCEATVQVPPFIARGNGGSGLMVLEPKEKLTVAQLGYTAAYINEAIRWRFSWSRQATISRVRRLEIPEPAQAPVRLLIRKALPTLFDTGAAAAHWKATFKPFPLDALYTLKPGDFHNTSALSAGPTPLVSCGDRNNGIVRRVAVPEETVYDHRLTISFNGMNTLTAKYHPYPFAAKDDVAVCTPRRPLRLATEALVQVMLGRERWRYSFYRKCFMERLRRFAVSLPAKGGEVDEDTVAAIMSTSPYWGLYTQHLA